MNVPFSTIWQNILTITKVPSKVFRLNSCQCLFQRISRGSLNMGLSHRIHEGYTLSKPAPGDRIIFENGKKDIVGETNTSQAEVLIKRGRAHICLEMPGEKTIPTQSSTEQLITSMMEADGISYGSFKKAGDLTGMSFKGAVRRISVSTTVESKVCDDTVCLTFSLGPGQYATTICREYMKANPIQMI